MSWNQPDVDVIVLGRTVAGRHRGVGTGQHRGLVRRNTTGPENIWAGACCDGRLQGGSCCRQSSILRPCEHQLPAVVELIGDFRHLLHMYRSSAFEPRESTRSPTGSGIRAPRFLRSRLRELSLCFRVKAKRSIRTKGRGTLPTAPATGPDWPGNAVTSGPILHSAIARNLLIQFDLLRFVILGQKKWASCGRFPFVFYRLR